LEDREREWIMARCKDSLRDGIFEPAQLADIEIAFLKAERHIRRSGTAFAPTVHRRELARRIVSEARDGETQPDLLWRAAVARMLVEHRVCG